MSEKMIFLIRHGQTQLSEKKRLIGQHDVELSETGIELTRQLGTRLQHFDFSHLLCSNLKRTSDMARIISPFLNLKPEPLKELNEISLGDWDGVYIDDIIKKYPEEYIKRGKDLIKYRISGGENFLDLHIRIKKIFDEILSRQGNILIIGHAAVNRVILAELLGMPLDNILKLSQDYGCCNIIAQDGLDLKVKLINGSMNCMN